MKWRSLEESGEYSDTRPLREIFAERKALIAQYVPPATQAIHEKVVSDLKASGMLAGVLKVGSKIPEFSLQDHNKKFVSSSDLLAKGRLVLCFIRGRWCPFCVGQLEAMNFIATQIRESGAELVAISPQTIQHAFFMADQHHLRFPLLLRLPQRSGSTIRPCLPCSRRATSPLSPYFCEPTPCQRGRQLGTAHSRHVRGESRRHNLIRRRQSGLHGKAGAA